MSEQRPDDLVPIRDAARSVDRGYSTLRKWIREGDLRGFHEVEADRMSALLVSRSELQTLMVRLNKAANPHRRAPAATAGPPSPAPSATPASYDIQLVRELGDVKANLARTEALLAGARDVNVELRERIAMHEARERDLAASLESERARTAAAEAELTVLRVQQGLPWWKRLLPLSS